MFRIWSLFSCGVVCGLLECQVPESWPQPSFSVPLAHDICDGQCVFMHFRALQCPGLSPSCLSGHWDLAFWMHMLTVPALCVCVCVYVHACNCVAVHLSTWTLTPSLINVRGLRQALHAAFCCDRQIIGPPVTPGVRVGTTHDASTKTAPPLMKQTCAIHTASALY